MGYIEMRYLLVKHFNKMVADPNSILICSKGDDEVHHYYIPISNLLENGW